MTEQDLKQVVDEIKKLYPEWFKNPAPFPPCYQQHYPPICPGPHYPQYQGPDWFRPTIIY